MNIIKIYFDSWKNQDLNIIKIFDENSIYKVKPFGEEEYTGLSQIIEYWKKNPMAQSQPNPKILECFSDQEKHKYFCEFENQFMVDNKIKITRGFILFEINNGIISELSEFYKSKYL